MSWTLTPAGGLSPIERTARVRQGLVVLALFGLALVVDPNHPLPFDICGWKALTGLVCPTCGLTRAICHALRGDVAASLQFHPAGVLAVALAGGWAIWSFAEAWSGRPLQAPARRFAGATLLRAGIAVSAVAWVVRLLDRF